MTGESTVTTETRGHVFHIGLNRAAKRNAFTMEMLHSLASAYGAYEQDPELRCALVFAHGEHFTTGLDLADVGPRVASGESLVCEGGLDPWRVLDSGTSKPVVVAVQGWCLTAGLELLLASDIRLAAQGTRFAQLEVKRGIMPFGGATLRLPRLTGWGNAMRYLLTGDEFDADEAYRIGLVQEVVTPEALLDRAAELAETVARQAPLAVQESLRSARLAVEEGPGAAAAALEEQVHRLMGSEDAMEGMMSFIERRDARFKGR
ncbi:MAG: crotonase/enoyl-CoA hydratase family protein [bacterium]